MTRQSYTDEVFPQETNSDLYPPALNQYLRLVVNSAVVDKQSGEFVFNAAVLDRIEAMTAPDQIRAAINDARAMSESSKKAAKNELAREGYSEIKLCLEALAELYLPIPPKPARHAPNNPFTLPPDPGPSLSNVRN